MITVVLTFICLLIALALFAGAFYLAKYVVKIQHRVAILEDSYKQATEHISEQEKYIIQMQQEMDFMRREDEMKESRKDEQRTRSWDPSNPMSDGRRYTA